MVVFSLVSTLHLDQFVFQLDFQQHFCTHIKQLPDFKRMLNRKLALSVFGESSQTSTNVLFPLAKRCLLKLKCQPSVNEGISFFFPARMIALIHSSELPSKIFTFIQRCRLSYNFDDFLS